MASFEKLFVVLAAAALFAMGTILNSILPPPNAFPQEYRWGKEGMLAIDMSLERKVISVEEPVKFTMLLTNVGQTRIRAYLGYAGISAGLYDENGERPRYYGPVVCPPARPDDEQFNRMTKVLDPGESIVERDGFLNYSSSGRGWDIQPGRTYHVIAFYGNHEERGYPALPCWVGGVQTAPQYFSVTA